jgi:hypothetical protein
MDLLQTHSKASCSSIRTLLSHSSFEDSIKRLTAETYEHVGASAFQVDTPRKILDSEQTQGLKGTRKDQ